MKKTEIEEIVLQIMTDVLFAPITWLNEIELEHNLITDLIADEADMEEIGKKIKKEFKIEIPKETLPNFVTVQDVADYIKLNLN